MAGPPVLVACAALRDDLEAALERLDLVTEVVYLPAALHLRPAELSRALAAVLDREVAAGRAVVVVYGRCCPDIDDLCAERGVRRTPGESCYQMMLGPRYDALLREEPGTYFLTDYLVQHFQELVVEGLGLDRRSKVTSILFRNYRRAAHINARDGRRSTEAEAAAARIGLTLRTERAAPRWLECALRATGSLTGDDRQGSSVDVPGVGL
jgi:hypothetical protein